MSTSLIHGKLFGLPEFTTGNQVVPLPTRKLMALLAYLSIQGPTPRSRLARLLWEATDARAMANLRAELHRLRQTALGGVLLSERGLLAVPELRTDLEQFTTLTVQSDWAAAVALRRGPFLEGLELNDAPEFEAWLDQTRELFEERFNTALLELARSLEAQNQPTQALETYRQLLERDPTTDAAQQAVMRLYERLQRPAKALEQHERQTARLHNELGAPPSKATTRIAIRLRQGKSIQESESLFVGRETALDTLHETLEAGLTAFITGSPGIGKTRLLHEYARTTGLPVTIFRGRPGDGSVPFSTVSRFIRETNSASLNVPEWVRNEIARIVPEFGTPAERTTAEEDRLRLFQAVSYFIRQVMPYELEHVALVDDVQFFDPISNQLMGFETVQARTQGARRRVLLAYRDGELPAELLEPIREHVRNGLGVMVKLRALEPTDVAETLKHLGSDHTAQPELVNALHRYTGGNPLFLHETLQSLGETQNLTLERFEQARTNGALPRTGRLKTLIESRLERLSPEARTLLEITTLAGDRMNTELATGILGLNQTQQHRALNELEQAGLLEDDRITHDVILEVARDAIPVGQRKRWHASIAKFLAQTDLHRPWVAEHWRLSGRDPVVTETPTLSKH